MDKKLLTVIIPFLNEKYEVENTLESIKMHSNGDVDIMLINDASDDNFDYEYIAKKHNAIYIVNPNRLGVAASRDLGIQLCQTPYFLLLDAHMRFYNNLWINRIVSELEEDKRSLLCCQTKVLELENGLLVEPINRGVAYGACVEINSEKELINPFWIYSLPFDSSQLQSVPIVCVLGAGYACTKEYWQYLRGLTGLKYYGTDEPYISIKVWLEGGRCKLLKDVVIGHIYRTNNFPYRTQMQHILYNKIFLAELFLNSKAKKKLLSNAKTSFASFLPESLFMLYENKDLVGELKEYHSKIFKHNFSFFEEMNLKYCQKKTAENILVEGVDKTLRKIAELTDSHPVSDIGLLRGSMGITIFLFFYSKMDDSELYKAKAEQRIEELLANIRPDTHYGLSTGLSGIGWGIEFLSQHGFIEGDTNEILEDFDKRIMEINPKRITNLNLDYGLGGVVLYILARLYSIEKENKINPFDQEYLRSVYDRICTVFDQRNTNCDSIDVFLNFINYFEGKCGLENPEIYDICSISNPLNIPLCELNIGLVGAAGLGLKLIFENSQYELHSETINKGQRKKKEK
jgi:glycosyltransferase involved in cell wall biosynthesis